MSAKPPVIGVKEYQQLLEKLVTEGRGVRNSDIMVFPSPGGNYYVTHDIQKGLEYKRDGKQPDGSDPAFYLKKKGFFHADYEAADPNNPHNGHLKQKPDSYRVAIQVKETTTVPVQWDLTDGFTIAAGGYLVTKQSSIAEISEALTAIREGTKTAGDALYGFAGPTGRTILKFDVYGIDSPALDRFGYSPVELSDDTKAIAARFAKAAAKAALPFTRRSSNFVSDHIAPERATFRKRSHGGPAV